MVQLSPILHVNQRKNEGDANSRPGFYLLETNEGFSCLLGMVNPKDLLRVQKAAPASLMRAGDERGKLFQAIYWDPIRLPKERGSLVRRTPEGASLYLLSGEDGASLRTQFSHAKLFAIGDEEVLDQAIRDGVENVEVALWNAGSPKVPWLPCHRVVGGVDWFQAGWMVCLAREHLFFRDVTREMRAERAGIPFARAVANALLTPALDETVTLLGITAQGAWRIHSKQGWANGALGHLHAAFRELAVVQLSELILPKGLSLDPGEGLQDGRLHVVTSADEAVRLLGNGAQVAYLLNPIGSEQLRELIQHQQMLPARSVALDVSALEVWNRAE